MDAENSQEAQLLEEIRKKEEQIEEELEKERNEASKLLKEVKVNAQNLLKDAEKSTGEELTRYENERRETTQLICQEILANAEKQSQQLSQTASKNKEKAIRLLLDTVQKKQG